MQATCRGTRPAKPHHALQHHPPAPCSHITPTPTPPHPASLCTPGCDCMLPAARPAGLAEATKRMTPVHRAQVTCDSTCQGTSTAAEIKPGSRPPGAQPRRVQPAGRTYVQQGNIYKGAWRRRDQVQENRYMMSGCPKSAAARPPKRSSRQREAGAMAVPCHAPSALIWLARCGAACWAPQLQVHVWWYNTVPKPSATRCLHLRARLHKARCDGNNRWWYSSGTLKQPTAMPLIAAEQAAFIRKWPEQCMQHCSQRAHAEHSSPSPGRPGLQCTDLPPEQPNPWQPRHSLQQHPHDTRQRRSALSHTPGPWSKPSPTHRVLLARTPAGAPIQPASQPCPAQRQPLVHAAARTQRDRR